MHKVLIEKLSGYPDKLNKLQWLEDELHDVFDGEVSLEWNQSKKCAQYSFSDDWEVEYTVLQHWADHVGGKFNITDEANNQGYYSAYIYA